MEINRIYNLKNKIVKNLIIKSFYKKFNEYRKYIKNHF